MKNTLEYIGNVTLFIKDVVFTLPKTHKSIHLIIEQVYFVGIGSLLIVIVTTFFCGAVTAYQAAFQGKDYLPDVYIGMAVIKGFMIELGPLLTAIIVSGRCGSAIAAEIGAMRITEQIDALETLGIEPVRYLVLPRIVGSAIALPLLTIVSELSACIGGGFCAVLLMNIKLTTYIEGLRFHFMQHELFGGLVKALVFGILMGLMSTYYGFKTTGGSEGVSKSTTQSVVSILILIIIFDFILARILF
ncbi:MAG: ABC transporter permease [bacterium]|nr:ABC transporter permease [bacterium]